MSLSDCSASYITTESGLQYRVIEEGDGEKPVASSVVTVHYAGCFEDGEEFDSSHKRNAPATFPLGGVIPGWTEGVQLMAVGSTFQFIIPHDLAYGEAGFGDVIPPSETLYFEIELISFE